MTPSSATGPASSPSFVIDRLVDLGWRHVPGSELKRGAGDVLLHGELSAALARLNPGAPIEAAIERLQTVVERTHLNGLVRANQTVHGFLLDGVPVTGHEPVRLLDFDNPGANDLIVADDVVFDAGHGVTELDVVLFVNGIPVVVGETKDDDGTLWFEAEGEHGSWIKAASSIAEHEQTAPPFFVPNILNFAVGLPDGEITGMEMHVGGIRSAVVNWEMWGSTADAFNLAGRERVERSIELLLNARRLLSIVRDFILYGTREHDGLVKITPRYPQVEAVEAIHRRALEPGGKQGLIVQHQGTGKTLAMVFATRKLYSDPALGNPTVYVIADRTDLVDQTHRQFVQVGMGEALKPQTRGQLAAAVSDPAQKVVITTIQKFGKVGVSNADENIIVLIDEAHRTQEGSLGDDMRRALPKARFFGFTGTPVVGPERNTFRLFGDPTDPGWVINEYLQERSIADGTVVRIHVDSRAVEYQLDEEKVNAEFERLVESEGIDAALTDRQIQDSVERALVESPQRIRGVCEAIVDHYYDHIEANGLKAQIVAPNREMCVAYEKEIQRILKERDRWDETAVVMSYDPNDAGRGWEEYNLSTKQVNKVVERFNSYTDPLKFLIVTSMLCTGFDAPIEGVMYLDKRLQRHTLFQTMSRVNRKWRHPETGWQKPYGVVVDFIGLGSAIAKAFAPVDPDAEMERLDGSIEGAFEQFDQILNSFLAVFDAAGVPVEPGSTESVRAGAIAIADSPELLRVFAHRIGKASDLWETLYPDERLEESVGAFSWMVAVYKAVLPQAEAQRELIRRLGAKTRELIDESISEVHVERASTGVAVLDAAAITKLRQHGLVVGETSGDESEDTGELPELEGVESGSAPTVNDAARALLKLAAGSSMTGDIGSPYGSIAERVRSVYERYLANALDAAALLEEILGAAEEVEEVKDNLREFAKRREATLHRLLANLSGSDDEQVLQRISGEIDGIVDYFGSGEVPMDAAAVEGAVREVLSMFEGVETKPLLVTSVVSYAIESCRAVGLQRLDAAV